MSIASVRPGQRVRQTSFQIRLDDTLYIGVPSDAGLARSHFCICYVAGESENGVFLVKDLDSPCGILVNGTKVPYQVEKQLNASDRISCSSHFDFAIRRGDPSL
jgi:hypothetical protein